MIKPLTLSRFALLSHSARATGLALSIVLASALSACSQEASEGAAPAEAVSQDKAFDLVAAKGHGFNAGAVMSAHKVYVFFDPQCPHCAHLWESAQTLMDKVHFVWMPVAFINGSSLPQGAALLQSDNPVEAMKAHEASILARQGGMDASASVPDEISSQIKANTALLNQLGAESVPFIVARNAKTQAAVMHAGAMPPAELAKTLGLD
ncbi:thioredoxin fold domain-containing protein [Hydrogenophaga sp. 5NK40-0174]|uniref:thioredoxin fold domain-containing protein n=1 Tax=Hydrogenophaga sp. 5NK40-0174 TaxID=3127649 RepID=UPI0031038618